jgi:membrane-anchored protein YejM (alkaline phosphatase superfamily)
VTAPRANAGYRRSALLWALLNAPLILLCSADSALEALRGLPPLLRALLVLAWLAESTFIAFIPFLVTLPLSFWPRVYRLAAPLVVAGAVLTAFVDGRVHRAFSFHLNGLLLRMILQRNGLTEAGLTTLDISVSLAAATLFVACSVLAGRWFIDRFASPRPVWRLALVIFALEIADRLAIGVMSFQAGPGLAAAGQTLPLQVPLTINRFMTRLTGRQKFRGADAIAAALARGRASPYGERPAASVRFARRPDVVFLLIESMRSGFLDSLTMPRLWRRAALGERFARHYTSATSTHYALFSLFYGLDARRFDAVVATGRRPLLFGALRENGYRLRLLAASSVDWMGLEQTVFHDVRGELETDFPGAGWVRDTMMVHRARQLVSRGDTAPVFLFLFFDGTHFRYTFPPGQSPFTPYWPGDASTMSAVTAPPRLIENRARNAAFAVDREIDEFLGWFAAERGREPLVLVTADHGEEYREKGRLGHGYDVTAMQTHVPMVIAGPGVAPGVSERVTSHIDLAPTLFALLGDTAAASTWCDGLDMFHAPAGRFVVSEPGWIPRYAVIGEDLKASFFGLAAGLGDMTVTDPDDRPVSDGNARLNRNAAAILRAIAGNRGAR